MSRPLHLPAAFGASVLKRWRTGKPGLAAAAAAPAAAVSNRETAPTPGAELPYRLPWRAASLRPGAHRGGMLGADGLFRDLALLFYAADPRRIDVRASVRDPFERLFVRRFEQKSAITVYVLADMSASMAAGGKMRLLTELTAAIAFSARRAGDRFGFIGCGPAVRRGLHIPATRTRAGETEFLEKLAGALPEGSGTDGFLEAARFLAGPRKLVVLISDFYMAPAEMEAIFAALARHDIVPLHLRSSEDLPEHPRWGLLPLKDLESGRRRLVLLRPSLRAAWQKADETRRAALTATALRYGRPPFEIIDRIPWDRLSSYLAGGAP